MHKLPLALIPLALSACATSQPSGQPTTLTQVQPAPETRIVEKIVPVVAPPEPKLSEKETKRPYVSPVAATKQAARKALELPRPERFRGATLVYPIIEGHVYNVLAPVDDIVSIEMPPGCRIIKGSPSLGDPFHDEAGGNWNIAKTFHGTPRAPVSKVVVRARMPGLKTTLQVDTDCGSYRYKLFATLGAGNEVVRFENEEPNMGYPLPPEPEEEKRKGQGMSCADTTVAAASYSYKITGDSPAWRPAQRDVFHNGQKLCIGLPDGLGSIETPAVLQPANGREMTVFYRTEGRFLEIDRVLPAVILRLGADGDKEEVRLDLQR